MIKTLKNPVALVFAFVIAVAASRVAAQRQPNLSLAHYWGKTESTISFIKDNDAIVIDGNGSAGNYFLQWRVVNTGATPDDTVAISDTVKIQTQWTTYKVQWGQGQFPNGMKQQDTVFITPSVNPVTLPLPAGLSASQDSVLTMWCDSVYFVSGEATNPAAEADPSDNTICDSVFVTYWRTKVEEIIGGNGIMLYPNPANGRLFVKSNLKGVELIRIIDVNGREVYHRRLNFSGAAALEISSFTPGFYILQLFADKGIVTERFVVR